MSVLLPGQAIAPIGDTGGTAKLVARHEATVYVLSVIPVPRDKSVERHSQQMRKARGRPFVFLQNILRTGNALQFETGVENLATLDNG